MQLAYFVQICTVCVIQTALPFETVYHSALGLKSYEIINNNTSIFFQLLCEV